MSAPPATLTQHQLSLQRPLSEALKQVANDLQVDPKQIAEAETAVNQADQVVEDLRSQLELVDADLQEEIAGDKELSNEVKRKAALGVKRKESDEYQDLSRQLRQAEAAAKQSRIDVRRFENEFRAHQRRLSALEAQVAIWFGGGR